jgi:hypothetical protein
MTEKRSCVDRGLSHLDDKFANVEANLLSRCVAASLDGWSMTNRIMKNAGVFGVASGTVPAMVAARASLCAGGGVSVSVVPRFLWGTGQPADFPGNRSLMRGLSSPFTPRFSMLRAFKPAPGSTFHLRIPCLTPRLLHCWSNSNPAL